MVTGGQSSDTTLVLDGGLVASSAVGRIGRGTRFPPQFGQAWFGNPAAQPGHQVHSKVQMNAAASGARSRSQHSQFGRISSIRTSSQVGPGSRRITQDQDGCARLARASPRHPAAPDSPCGVARTRLRRRQRRCPLALPTPRTDPTALGRPRSLRRLLYRPLSPPPVPPEAWSRWATYPREHSS